MKKSIDGVKLNVGMVEVKNLKYVNTFSVSPDQLKLKIENSTGVQCNPNAPTQAAVLTRFSATDEQGALSFEMETITPVNVSTYVDNLEELIQKDYMTVILVAVNEKIRALSAMVGISLNAMAVGFTLKGE